MDTDYYLLRVTYQPSIICGGLCKTFAIAATTNAVSRKPTNLYGFAKIREGHACRGRFFCKYLRVHP